MEILTQSIRKEKNQDRYRVKVAWRNKQGIKRSLSELRDSKEAAQAYLKFRLGGLRGGK